MSFRDALAGRDPSASVQLVQTRAKNARIFNDHLADYFSARREAEDAYVKQLLRISKRLAFPDAQYIPNGFSGVLERLMAEITEITEAHATLERSLQRDCEEPLRTAHGTGEWAALRDVNDELAPTLKEVNTQEGHLQRDHKKFESKRTTQTQQRLQETQTALAGAYADWDARSPAAFDAYERVDRRRLELMRDVVRRHARATADAARAVHEAARNTSRGIDAFQPSDDFTAFVSGVGIPQRAPLDGTMPASPAPSAAPSAAPSGGGLKTAFNRLSRLPQTELFSRRQTSTVGITPEEKEAISGESKPGLLSVPGASQARSSVALPSAALENARLKSNTNSPSVDAHVPPVNEPSLPGTDDAALARVREQLQGTNFQAEPPAAERAAPNLQGPSLSTPSLNTPHFNAPAPDASLTAPSLHGPSVQAESIHTPSADTPSASISTVGRGVMPAQDYQGGGQPASEHGTLNGMRAQTDRAASTPQPVAPPAPAAQAQAFPPMPQRAPTADALHLDAYVTERVHASLAATGVARVVVVGEVALALREAPTALHTTHARIHVDARVPLEKIAVNPNIAVHAAERSLDVHLGAVWQAQLASGSAVVMRYQLQINPAESLRYVPLLLRAQWKCEPQQSSLLVTYRNNAESHYARHGSSLNDVTFEVTLPPSQKITGNVLSRPTGEWDPDVQHLAWRAPALPAGDMEGHQLLARFPLASTGTPLPIEATWEVPATAGASGMQIGNPSHITEVLLCGTTHRTLAGKYYVESN